MSSLAQMTVSFPLALRDAVRVAEIGYTAVIDRFTPQLTLADVDANVRRSVGNGGGAPAELLGLERLTGQGWRAGAVSVFEERRTSGPLGAPGAVAFAITAEASGARAAVAATAVLHEPSPELRADAAALSDAVRSILDLIRDGIAVPRLSGLFRDRIDGSVLRTRATAVCGVPLRASSPFLEPDAAVEAVVREGDALLIGGRAQTADGVIVFGTSVLVTADGVERLDGIPLRLIELR